MGLKSFGFNNHIILTVFKLIKYIIANIGKHVREK